MTILNNRSTFGKSAIYKKENDFLYFPSKDSYPLSNCGANGSNTMVLLSDTLNTLSAHATQLLLLLVSVDSTQCNVAGVASHLLTWQPACPEVSWV